MKWDFCFLVAAILAAGLQLSFAADTDVSKLAAANNAFAFKLLKQINAEQPTNNIFISPYSAATALQMVANGAGGQTKIEMQEVLGTSDLTIGAINEAGRNVAGLMNSKNKNFILTTANALWFRQGAKVEPHFLEMNRQFFHSTINSLDFGNVPAAEAKINHWASDHTHGRITGITDDMITPFTDLILANAIYFKDKWLDPFDAKLTKERTFHPATSGGKNMPMMEKSKKFAYREGSGHQAVRLPYKDCDLAMYVFLPDPGSSPAKLLQIMNADNWQGVMLPGFGERKGLLVLPKFKLENTLGLNSSLKAMGMKTAFNEQADFSEMFNEPHHISEVRQKAFVEVNEEGTEAAAVTGIAVTALAATRNPLPPFEMIVDRPFLFVIVDARSEMILFMGVVNEL